MPNNLKCQSENHLRLWVNKKHVIHKGESLIDRHSVSSSGSSFQSSRLRKADKNKNTMSGLKNPWNSDRLKGADIPESQRAYEIARKTFVKQQIDYTLQ